LIEPKLHEAGYDAFLTGYIFYNLVANLKELAECRSKLKIIRSMYDINLASAEDIYSEKVILQYYIEPDLCLYYQKTNCIHAESVWVQKEENGRTLVTHQKHFH
jgi:hypothetical protein